MLQAVMVNDTAFRLCAYRARNSRLCAEHLGDQIIVRVDAIGDDILAFRDAEPDPRFFLQGHQPRCRHAVAGDDDLFLLARFNGTPSSDKLDLASSMLIVGIGHLMG